ncbi:Bifunctional nuclease with DNase and RNase activity [Methanonatronarchaeum thermophilum]|uniref:Bifunctional nuclease with DNase and RNase activity n=1 Tax=Methanonatronarchaeum thermophilum TaxID=1927129 RepID=A0A1Y3GA95_9EURY|nr:bifunctional nuclease family protein [Methanonatronarchaeum thermophilum]OUJ18348.1 Bifunctional nuclease with DNase and RNase activity [Methanonatronarchaeum thermophilum]
MNFIEVEVYEVGRTGDGAIILLQGVDDMSEKVLPILCSPMQGGSIKMGMSQLSNSRPHSHDLFVEILNELGCALDKVLVTEMKDSVYYAELHISLYQKEECEELVIDARPSDSIAIATRVRSPIYVKKDLMEKRGVSPSSFKKKE